MIFCTMDFVLLHLVDDVGVYMFCSIATGVDRNNVRRQSHVHSNT